MARFLALLLCAFSIAAHGAPNRELVVCGWDEVFILDLNQTPPQKVWSWKAIDDSALPREMHAQFRTTDECKPVDGGRRILITSSSDGVALVERSSRKVLFFGSAGGAHSAEMLPGGRIAVAASTSKNPLANRLVVFDVKRSGRPLSDTELVSGHGAVWDARRNVLWALGLKTLRTYRLERWNTPQPELAKDAEYELPDAGGHDLMAVPNTDLLSVTTNQHAWVFDREKKTFSPHPLLADAANVKSIHVHAETGEVAWTQADPGFWWTSTLRFLNPTGTVQRAGERLYKARWANSLPQPRR